MAAAPKPDLLAGNVAATGKRGKTHGFAGAHTTRTARWGDFEVDVEVEADLADFRCTPYLQDP